MTYSFVVIAYNEEANIERALNSIFGLSGLKDYEVIVIDDGSTDRTAEVVTRVAKRRIVLKLITFEDNQGRGSARAAGVNAAKGDYIVFVDADIVLPKNWLRVCSDYITTCDACGGIAIPDGDVAFIHRVFRLRPKVVPQTTTVPGSNGMFKRYLFDHVSFNETKKNGEDTELGYQIAYSNFKTIMIKDLHVEHAETKTYIQSLVWLFVNGAGATRHLVEHGHIKLPDIAFFGFIVVSSVCVAYSVIIGSLLPLLVLLAYPLATSIMHIRSKFYPGKTAISWVKYFTASIVNTPLILFYYVGRAAGLVKWSY